MIKLGELLSPPEILRMLITVFDEYYGEAAQKFDKEEIAHYSANLPQDKFDIEALASARENLEKKENASIEQVCFSKATLEDDEEYPDLWATWEISREPICYKIPVTAGDHTRWLDEDGVAKYDYIATFFYDLPNKFGAMYGFRIDDGEFAHLSCFAS